MIPIAKLTMTTPVIEKIITLCTNTVFQNAFVTMTFLPRPSPCMISMKLKVEK